MISPGQIKQNFVNQAAAAVGLTARFNRIDDATFIAYLIGIEKLCVETRQKLAMRHIYDTAPEFDTEE